MIKIKESSKNSIYSTLLILISLVIFLRIFFHFFPIMSLKQDLIHTKSGHSNGTGTNRNVALQNCYKMKKPHKKVKFLENILKSPPKSNKNIFFIDTLCRKNHTLTFKAR